MMQLFYLTAQVVKEVWLVLAICFISTTGASAQPTFEIKQIEYIAELYEVTGAKCTLMDLYRNAIFSQVEVYDCVATTSNLTGFNSDAHLIYINGTLVAVEYDEIINQRRVLYSTTI